MDAEKDRMQAIASAMESQQPLGGVLPLLRTASVSRWRQPLQSLRPRRLAIHGVTESRGLYLSQS